MMPRMLNPNQDSEDLSAYICSRFSPRLTGPRAPREKKSGYTMFQEGVADKGLIIH